MQKTFKSAISNNPRYIRLLRLMTIFIVLSIVVSLVYTYRSYNERQKTMTPEEFERVKPQIVYAAVANIVTGVVTVGLIIYMSKKRTEDKIVLTNDGVKQYSFRRKKFIPWDGIKDLKLIAPGTAFEKCKIVGKDESIIFNAFYLDESIPYKIGDDKIADEHGQPVTNAVKKSRLYKEIKMRTKKD